MFTSKKLMSLLLVLVLLGSIIAGCTSGNDNEEASPNESGGETAEGSGDQAGDQTENKELPSFLIYPHFSTMKVPEGSNKQWLTEMQNHVREQVGVDAQVFLSSGDREAWTTKLNLMLGSGEQVDVWMQEWPNYRETILPINDLLEEHGQNILKVIPKDAWKLVTDADGNIWGIPRQANTTPYPVWIRKDWLDKLGLEMPQTIDELEAVLKAFKEGDPDGNGQDDTIPLRTEIGSIRDLHIRGVFAGAFVEHGNGNWLDPSDNKIKPVELADGYKEFLAKMADWYQKGYIYKDSFSEHNMLELLKTGKVGASGGWYSGITLQAPKVAEQYPEMNFQPAFGMTGKHGVMESGRPGGVVAYMIHKKAEHPEAIMKYIDWQYENIENHLTARYGIQGKSWDWEDKANSKIELLDKDQNYLGELNLSDGLANETQYSSSDPLLAKHADYLNNHILRTDEVKMPIDTGVFYDPKLLSEAVPTAGDIERLRGEEMIKFIMGARPLSEFDQFIDELYKAGLQDWIDFHTKVYMEHNK